MPISSINAKIDLGYLTLPSNFSVFSMYVSAIVRASRILGATEKAARFNTLFAEIQI